MRTRLAIWLLRTGALCRVGLHVPGEESTLIDDDFRWAPTLRCLAYRKVMNA